MFAMIKAVHLLALVLALGGGIARLTLGPVAMKHPEARAVIAPVLARFATLHYAGLILLWLSGLWLYGAGYLGGGLGPAFHAKMAAVVALTGISATVWVRTRRGTPFAPPRARLLGQITVGLACLAVIFAALAFG